MVLLFYCNGNVWNWRKPYSKEAQRFVFLVFLFETRLKNRFECMTVRRNFSLVFLKIKSCFEKDEYSCFLWNIWERTVVVHIFHEMIRKRWVVHACREVLMKRRVLHGKDEELRKRPILHGQDEVLCKRWVHNTVHEVLDAFREVLDDFREVLDPFREVLDPFR